MDSNREGGQLIDVLLVPVAKQPETRKKKASIKADKSSMKFEFHSAKRRQIDTDARYNVNRRDNHYGYKNHVNVDKQHKLIRRYCEASLFQRLVRFGLERRSG
jgi:predicted phage tail protein